MENIEALNKLFDKYEIRWPQENKDKVATLVEPCQRLTQAVIEKIRGQTVNINMPQLKEGMIGTATKVLFYENTNSVILIRSSYISEQRGDELVFKIDTNEPIFIQKRSFDENGAPLFYESALLDLDEESLFKNAINNAFFSVIGIERLIHEIQTSRPACEKEREMYEKAIYKADKYS